MGAEARPAREAEGMRRAFRPSRPGGAGLLCGPRRWHTGGMSEAPAQLPFRWDLVTRDQLGSLLAGMTQPDLWSPGRMAWRRRPLTTAERAQARRMLAGLGLAPRSLARRDVPVVFTDVVAGGSTFGDLFAVLRAWIDDEHAQWDVIRRKLRFTGVTSRVKTSPNAFRWQQHAPWARQLPASSIVNVSLDRATWSYLADHQAKLTRSFPPAQWLAEAAAPGRDDNTRQALAQAVSLVSYGRSPEGRKALARTMDKEPALSQSWLRSLITHLNSGT
jgi:hypothetical protein